MTKQQPHLRKIEKGLYSVVNWRRQHSTFHVGDIVSFGFKKAIIKSIDTGRIELYEIYTITGQHIKNVRKRQLILIKRFDGKGLQIKFGI